jgi:hypothetical protein
LEQVHLVGRHRRLPVICQVQPILPTLDVP